MPRAAVDGDDRPFHPPANGLNWGFAPMGVSSVCAVHHAACFASNSAHVAGRPPGLLARAGLRVCTLFRVTSEGSSPPGAMDKPVLSYAQTGDLLSQGLMLRCTERMIVYVARRTERVCGIQAHVDRFELPPAALRARFGRIALPCRTSVRLSSRFIPPPPLFSSGREQRECSPPRCVLCF